MVHAGDLLAEIDPRAFQVQLMQAEGQLLRDESAVAECPELILFATKPCWSRIP